MLGLWDSWEDGAVIADKERGIYLDRDKLHFLNHNGKHFSVRGPLTVHRSPQGHPVIVQAGQSDDGRDLAAETAEVTFTVQQDLEAGRAFYADIKRRAAAYGRPPHAHQGAARRNDRDRPHARRGRRQIRATAGAAVARTGDQGSVVLFRLRLVDLSARTARCPIRRPDIEQKGRVKMMVDLARRENLTIRQLYKRVYGQRGHRVVIGTPSEVADALESWFRGGAADGFNIMPLTFPRGLEDIVDLLIPELQRRGLFRTRYEGKTLRENLGLPYPENRWAEAREKKDAG